MRENGKDETMKHLYAVYMIQRPAPGSAAFEAYRDVVAEMPGSEEKAALLWNLGFYRMVAGVMATSLEDAWARTQNVERPWGGEEGVKLLGGRSPFQTRSTMVGDIFRSREDGLQMVVGLGFRKVAS